MLDWSALQSRAAPGSVPDLQTLATVWTARAATHARACGSVQLVQALADRSWSGSAGAVAFANSLQQLGRSFGAAGTAEASAGAALAAYALTLQAAQTAAAGYVVAGAGADARLAGLLARSDPGTVVLDRVLHQVGGPSPLVGADQAEADSVRAAVDLQALALETTRAAQQAAATIRAAHDDLRAVATGAAALLRPSQVDVGLHGSPGYARWLADWSAGHDPSGPAGAAAVRAWADLAPGERRALIERYPDAVGNASGVDAVSRDEANRAALARDADAIADDLHRKGIRFSLDVDPSGTPNAEVLTAQLRAAGWSGAQLLQARDVLVARHQLDVIERTSTAPMVQLLVYQPSAFGGRGRIAVAMGDVGTAANVTVVVPGMKSDVPNHLPEEVTMAENIYRAGRATGTGDLATVAYIGYRAPGVDLTVTNQALASIGAQQVAQDLTDIAALRTAPGHGHLTGVFHSYGTVLAGTMAKEYAPPVDDYVLAGSPGAGRATSAADMGRPGHVFVLASSSDPVTTKAQQAQDPDQRDGVTLQAGAVFGGAAGLLAAQQFGPLLGAAIHPDLGRDPAGSKFGAVRLEAESVDKNPWNVANHQYAAEHSEGLQSIDAVQMGRPDLMHRAPARPEAGDHYAGSDPEYPRPPHDR